MTFKPPSGERIFFLIAILLIAYLVVNYFASYDSLAHYKLP